MYEEMADMFAECSCRYESLRREDGMLLGWHRIRSPECTYHNPQPPAEDSDDE